MQDFQTQQNYMLKKMLPPFGEEGHSANENVGFPVIKPHVGEGRSADEHAGFQSQRNHMSKHDTMLMKHYLFIGAHHFQIGFTWQIIS